MRRRSFWGWGWEDKFPDDDRRRENAFLVGGIGLPIEIDRDLRLPLPPVGRSEAVEALPEAPGVLEPRRKRLALVQASQRLGVHPQAPHHDPQVVEDLGSAPVVAAVLVERRRVPQVAQGGEVVAQVPVA